MSKLIAVQDCTIDYDLPDDALGSVSLVTEVAPATSKTLAKGNRAYKKEIVIAVVSGSVTLSSTPEGATSPSGTVPPGSIKIEGSSEKSTTGEDVFVVENDEGEETFVCVFPGPNGSTVPADVKIRAKVSDAGQDVSKVT